MSKNRTEREIIFQKIRQKRGRVSAERRKRWLKMKGLFKHNPRLATEYFIRKMMKR